MELQGRSSWIAVPDDDGKSDDEVEGAQGVTDSATVPKFGPGHNAPQLAIVLLLTCNVGAVLSLHKLAMLDSAGRQFGRASYASKTSFLIPYAISKATVNLLVGPLADGIGRKKALVAGWCVGLVAPAMAMAAPPTTAGWALMTASAAVLGLQQGLCWSACLLICIDLAGPQLRGAFSGLNETFGYSGVAIFVQVYAALEARGVSCAWASGAPPAASAAAGACGAEARCAAPDDWQPACLGLCLCSGYTGAPFRVEASLMAAGLVATLVLVRDTFGTHAAPEAAAAARRPAPATAEVSRSGRGGGGGGDGGGGRWAAALRARAVFVETTWGNRSTAVVCVAGFCTNLVTGLAWGLMAAWARDGLGMSGASRNFAAACYSFPKGLVQAPAGAASDLVGRRGFLAFGLLGAAAALALAALGAGYGGRLLPAAQQAWPEASFAFLTVSSLILGLSQGLAYPALGAAVADHSPALTRGAALGSMRFWRDLGYAGGAAGAAAADAASPETALVVIAAGVAAVAAAVWAVYEEAPG